MQLNDLAIVLKTAELGSITRAAEQLDLQIATASAAIKRVERHLGFPLFIRSTRQLKLSPGGERYLPECQKAYQILQQAEQQATVDSPELKGELRLTASSDLGRHNASHWLDRFLETHPALKISLHLSDQQLDFYREKIDIALRYGPPSEQFYGFKICEVPKVLCAAPSYLEQQGKPQSPMDLKNHPALFYQLHQIVHDRWIFKKGEQQWRIKMKGQRRSNDGDLVRRWCVNGHGIALKSCLDISADLLAGRLIPLLKSYQRPTTELWLITPSREHITSTFRLLRDHLQNESQQCLKTLKQRRLI